MPTVAFLTSQELPNLTAEDRLAAAELRTLGITVEPVIWDCEPDLVRFDAMVLRSTWDYQEKIDAFIAWLKYVEALHVPLWNPPATVSWNLDKVYLRELRDCGVAIVPTHFPVEGENLEDILRSLRWVDAVVKPRISADSFRTRRTHPSTAATDQNAFAELVCSPNRAMVQPFMQEVQDVGEFSFVFIGGKYSHAVLKKPKSGDYRVQLRYGGTVSRWMPGPNLIEASETVLEKIPVHWLYARVDACVRRGQLLVMEVELIEPSLFLDYDLEAPRRFAEVIQRAITAGHAERRTRRIHEK